MTAQEKAGDYQQALQTLKDLRDLDDELAVEEVRNRITELSLRHEVEAKAKELESVRRDRDAGQLELSRARTMRLALIVGLVAVSMGAALAIRGYRAEADARGRVRRAHDELTIAYARLEEVSRTDTLTGIANRRAIQDVLESEMARVARGAEPFAIVMLDLDHFKAVNDRYGHGAGDEMLRAVAQTIRETSRRHDSIARWGGEELIMVLPETSLAGAAEVADRVRREVASLTVVHDGHHMSVTVTAGVAAYNQGSSVEACIGAADRALYGGKAEGRNRVVIDGENEQC